MKNWAVSSISNSGFVYFISASGNSSEFWFIVLNIFWPFWVVPAVTCQQIFQTEERKKNIRTLLWKAAVYQLIITSSLFLIICLSGVAVHLCCLVFCVVVTAVWRGERCARASDLSYSASVLEWYYCVLKAWEL